MEALESLVAAIRTGDAGGVARLLEEHSELKTHIDDPAPGRVAGGFPITVGGEVIGAVAAGGASIEHDVLVAQAALAALGLPGT